MASNRTDLSTAVWRKSSYSNGDGGNCVEVAAVWRKSSYSNGDGGDCVEVAPNLPALVPVRDSKNLQGPVLAFPRDSWALFLDSLRAS